MAARQTLKTAALWAGRILLGGAFAYAAVNKLLDPQAFVADIGHYRLLPYPLAIVMGIYLPWLELACAAAVLTRRFEGGALALLLGLCGVFSVALASAWMRGLDINCGCFGHGATPNLPLALARCLILGFISLILVIRRRASGILQIR